MNVGTKSVLFGAHCFIIHPVFVFFAWWKLYGFPWDPRLWIAFFVHDLGYLGKPNMDGEEGETHVELGARIMSIFGQYWSDFSRYHSRFYAKKQGMNPSRLCIADKLATCLEPSWLYLLRVNWTGEIQEYMRLAESRNAYERTSKYETMALSIDSQNEWFNSMKHYLMKWVEEHKDGKDDDWTPGLRKTINTNGVYQ